MRQFQNYVMASRLNKEEKEFQCAVFLATVGEEAMDIFDGFQFDVEEDRKDLEKVMQAFEAFCVGETHEAYESYKFHMRKQRPEETIEAYITSLRQLAKPCNFGSIQVQDRLIRDQVVIGAREESLREKFLEDKHLTLDKCLTIGRAFETSRQQSQTISTGQEPETNINRLQNLNSRAPRTKYRQDYRGNSSPKCQPVWKTGA